MKKITLAGSPNCGKTMLFNRLTGKNMRVANFPGVTVEKKEGFIKNTDILLTDLPGTYSLSPASDEERVTADILKAREYDLILCVIDGTHLEKGINFVKELLTLEMPVLVAVNMADLLPRSGIDVDYALLGKITGVPFLPVSAKNGYNVDALVNAAKGQAQGGGGFPQLPPTPEILSSVMSKTDKGKGISYYIDKAALHPFFAPVIFVVIFTSVFLVLFSAPVFRASEYLENLFSVEMSALSERLLLCLGANPRLVSFFCSAVFVGIGSVVSFLPQLSLLFFFMTVLEDSGYMARACLIADKPLSKAGLSGKSFFPLLLGFGCTAAALTSVRTVSSPKGRLCTALVLPFISCSARLPIYLLFADRFFPSHKLLFAAVMYLPGLALLGVSAFVFSGGRADDFILELPDYRLPSASSVAKETLTRIYGFLTKAGTLIFCVNVITLTLQSVRLGGVTLLEAFGRGISFVFRPLGFDFPEAASALISGLFAKEGVVSVLSLLSGRGGIESLFTAASALSFTVFCSCYPPCLGALSVMKKEMGLSVTLFSVIYQTLCAYLLSAAAYFAASFIL